MAGPSTEIERQAGTRVTDRNVTGRERWEPVTRDKHRSDPEGARKVQREIPQEVEVEAQEAKKTPMDRMESREAKTDIRWQ